MEYSAGHADALQRLRMRSFGVVITSPDSTVEEDLALLEEMRAIRPGVKSIVLARHSTPDEVIAALRARVFACFTPRVVRNLNALKTLGFLRNEYLAAENRIPRTQIKGRLR
jgi:DNA-binding NtrC family response regulator